MFDIHDLRITLHEFVLQVLVKFVLPNLVNRNHTMNQANIPQDPNVAYGLLLLLGLATRFRINP